MALISQGPPIGSRGKSRDNEWTSGGEQALEVGGAVHRLANPRMVVVKVRPGARKCGGPIRILLAGPFTPQTLKINIFCFT